MKYRFIVFLRRESKAAPSSAKRYVGDPLLCAEAALLNRLLWLHFLNLECKFILDQWGIKSHGSSIEPIRSCLGELTQNLSPICTGDPILVFNVGAFPHIIFDIKQLFEYR